MKSRNAHKKKRVLVFGVFDFLHPGHISFLRQARKRGAELTVVVARDSVVQKLKKKKPYHGECERIAALRRLPFVSKAFLGDNTQGTYMVFKKWKPDVICVGYDQDRLEKDLASRMEEGSIPKILIVKMRSYAPYKFRSSLLRQAKGD